MLTVIIFLKPFLKFKNQGQSVFLLLKQTDLYHIKANGFAEFGVWQQ